MDKEAFLGGENNGGGSRDRSSYFPRRSDAIARNSPYQKAAALVDLAEDGVGLPEQILDYNREYYFLGQLPYLTGAESLVYEGATLIILMIYTFFPISYEGFHIYWNSHLNQLKGITGEHPHLGWNA
ncbi:Two pore calcium channel protein 1 [Camellia lanceoleosa]|uniref:Two pore calcium channel protein 1 n=1 Tax=Camellia lanceoleosa TaxID=1840588 RepID=A0ACC0F5I0_9ERIC|nr:Two pore calcium channel protein 1 [Camellia lanceoleosa]